MRSGNSSIGQKTSRTFTETARRAQIAAAAMDTIAELGYGQASLARIAETAGTSKGVILYHFGSKDELIRELVAQVVAGGVAYMEPRIEAEPTGAGKLRAYIESNLAFMRENRNHMVAIVEIALNARAADGSRLTTSRSRTRGWPRSSNCSPTSRAPASSGPASIRMSWRWRSVPPSTRCQPSSPGTRRLTSATMRTN